MLITHDIKNHLSFPVSHLGCLFLFSNQTLAVCPFGLVGWGEASYYLSISMALSSLMTAHLDWDLGVWQPGKSPELVVMLLGPLALSGGSEKASDTLEI